MAQNDPRRPLWRKFALLLGEAMSILTNSFQSVTPDVSSGIANIRQELMDSYDRMQALNTVYTPVSQDFVFDAKAEEILKLSLPLVHHLELDIPRDERNRLFRTVFPAQYRHGKQVANEQAAEFWTEMVPVFAAYNAWGDLDSAWERLPILMANAVFETKHFDSATSALISSSERLQRPNLNYFFRGTQPLKMFKNFLGTFSVPTPAQFVDAQIFPSLVLREVFLSNLGKKHRLPDSRIAVMTLPSSIFLEYVLEFASFSRDDANREAIKKYRENRTGSGNGYRGDEYYQIQVKKPSSVAKKDVVFLVLKVFAAPKRNFILKIGTQGWAYRLEENGNENWNIIGDINNWDGTVIKSLHDENRQFLGRERDSFGYCDFIGRYFDGPPGDKAKAMADHVIIDMLLQTDESVLSDIALFSDDEVSDGCFKLLSIKVHGLLGSVPLGTMVETFLRVPPHLNFQVAQGREHLPAMEVFKKEVNLFDPSLTGLARAVLNFRSNPPKFDQLNGLSDADMMKILEIHAKFENYFKWPDNLRFAHRAYSFLCAINNLEEIQKGIFKTDKVLRCVGVAEYVKLQDERRATNQPTPDKT
ncbi:hypothetical protein HDU93_006008 [Gonapodya sp. JEL0774]|nr:hypothetical protein HDU93_006008 [Gonapodya sp. JEL0774]